MDTENLEIAVEFLHENWIRILFGAFILSLAILVGYIVYLEIDSHSLMEGVIVSKDYRPAWTQIVCIPTGKSSNCYPIAHPECYCITIHGIDPKGVEKSRIVSVDPSTFERLRQNEKFKVSK